MQDCIWALTAIQFAPYYFLTGEVPQRLGNGQIEATPFNTYPARDGHVLIAIVTVGQWQKFLHVIGREDMLDKKEYAWAAKLANQLYLIDKQDKDARQLKANALRQMAYVSTGANDRAHLMSQALALEGKTTIARLIPPQTAFIIATPTKYVDYFRVRIDPLKSDQIDKVVRFDSGLTVRQRNLERVRLIENPQERPHQQENQEHTSLSY